MGCMGIGGVGFGGLSLLSAVGLLLEPNRAERLLSKLTDLQGIRILRD